MSIPGKIPTYIIKDGARTLYTGDVYFSASVDVASQADLVSVGGYDLSAGNRTLDLATETAVAADVGLASTHSLTVRINQASYKIPLVSV